MNTQALSARIYVEGFKAADFQMLKPGLVIVEPIRPPELLRGIHSPESKQVPGSACLLFKVLAVADQMPGDALQLIPGDVVTVRNAHLDPVQPNQNVLSIKVEHVLSRLVKAPEDVARIEE